MSDIQTRFPRVLPRLTTTAALARGYKPCMGAASPTILVLNAGSSSVKYELFSMDPERSLVAGEVETRSTTPREAAERAFAALRAEGHLDGRESLVAIGHRVVHGGDLFDGPALVDEAVLEGIRSLMPLAPLHLDAALAGVAVARDACPGVPNVAVFDTSFHRTMPAHAREYALPRALAREHAIRRYGFHGTSYAYVASRAAAMLDRPLEEVDLIALHLGNGASAAAIRGGKSVDTSMGMTPLEGLVMGTRCGDVDPAVPLLIGERAGMDASEVHRALTRESGLVGMCG
ncbi:MAG TPA: hypothetical protein VFH17_06525, partial [Coriobacteriia bacterium]|nr:hypothetical protein [Coriobacteriia bacterium]